MGSRVVDRAHAIAGFVAAGFAAVRRVDSVA